MLFASFFYVVRTFAACTAKSLEQIRKTTEMIFLSQQHQPTDKKKPDKDDRQLLVRRVEAVHALVCHVCRHVDRLSNQYAGCLALGGGEAATSAAAPSASSLITDLYVEASNSNRYIQDGLELCLPIFKLAWLNGGGWR